MKTAPRVISFFMNKSKELSTVQTNPDPIKGKMEFTFINKSTASYEPFDKEDETLFFAVLNLVQGRPIDKNTKDVLIQIVERDHAKILGLIDEELPQAVPRITTEPKAADLPFFPKEEWPPAETPPSQRSISQSNAH